MPTRTPRLQFPAPRLPGRVLDRGHPPPEPWGGTVRAGGSTPHRSERVPNERYRASRRPKPATPWRAGPGSAP